MTTTKTYNPKANCIGVEPQMFDYPECYADALEICEPCPVRLWCLQLVDPARSYYDGVAGGHIWQNGKPTTHSNDPALKTYLATVPHDVQTVTVRRRVEEPDYIAVDALLAGNIHHSKLTADERRIACRKLIDLGYNYTEVLERTGVAPHVYKRILKGMKR